MRPAPGSNAAKDSMVYISQARPQVYVSLPHVTCERRLLRMQVRAMQIIDELELAKRGPYGGGIGHVSFTGGMDMALALRTMVIPTAATDTFYEYGPDKSRREWVVHLQAGAGLVADSVCTFPKCDAMSRRHD